MKHADDLHDYLTGALGDVRQAEVEAHLRDCGTCREELRQLNETLESLVETLPPVEPPAAVLDVVKARTLGKAPPPRPRERPPVTWGLAAVLGLLLIGTLFQLNQSQRKLRVIEEESRLMADRLALDGASLLPLLDSEMNPLGGIVVLPESQALYVLKAPPPRAEAYQLWGIDESEKTTSLIVSERRVFEVSTLRYRRLRLSLEPANGSPKPTKILNEISLAVTD